MSTPSDVQALLELVRDTLAAVPGVATCKVGREANMTPADYPMVRIVPTRIGEGDLVGRRSVSALVYFGQPIHEFTNGLESLYWQHLAMEDSLRGVLLGPATPFRCEHHETLLDEDRVEAYKVLAMRVTLEP